jgi:hypothetical protein
MIEGKLFEGQWVVFSCRRRSQKCVDRLAVRGMIEENKGPCQTPIQPS